MVDIESLISPLIQQQFPDFYLEEGPSFIAFTKAYYEWLEESGNPIYHSRLLPSYRDIDTTTEEFILHFKEKYLKNIEFETTTNKKLLIKHSLDVYRSKGTTRAIDLLFKLVYGTGADVYRPGDDLFKLSDSTWVRPYYIEISASPRTVGLVGKTITGVNSGATAFVEKYIKRRVQDKYVHLLYISNINGSFEVGELLHGSPVYSDSPRILGSLAQIFVISGGIDFSVGDIVEIDSASGDGALARVAEVSSQSGKVDFVFVDGGYGYTNAPAIYISNTVLSLANVQANTTDTYAVFEVLRQPLTDIGYTSLNGTFTPGVNVFSTTGTGVGRLIEIDTDAETMKVSRESGDFTAGGKIYIAGNTANATISTSVNNDITGTVTKLPTEVSLIVIDPSPFEIQQNVYQTDGSIDTANGTIVNISSNILQIENIKGTFVTTEPLKITGSSATGTISSISMNLAVHNVSNTFLEDFNPVVYGVDSGPTARVTSVSEGSGADFDIFGIANTESIVVNSDLLSANNTSNTAFLSLLLNASTYGFPANTSANLSSIIWNTLDYDTYTIGVIAGIINENPGEDYNADPQITINEQVVSVYNRRDYVFNITDATGSFIVGEQVTQTNELDAWDVTLGSNTGWIIGEHVWTATGNGNISSISGTTMHIGNAVGTFSGGQTLRSVIDSTNTSISSPVQNNDSVTAHGVVSSGSNTSLVFVSRRQFDNWFEVSSTPLTGELSGTTATITAIGEDQNTMPIGLNANVQSDVGLSGGTVSMVGVTDSGFGYVNGSSVSFSMDFGQKFGTGTALTTAVGRGSGYFKTTKGFLSADKYLHDGDYYQEYSYEVFSALPFDKYAELLKEVLHAAGTRAFGSVRSISFSENGISINSSSRVQDWIDPVVEFDLTEELDSRITFTRSSNATMFAANGTLVTVGEDVARFDYDPVTGDPLGLLVEDSRTNVILYSQDLSNAAWNKSNSSVSANTIAGPDGSSVPKLSSDSSSGSLKRIYQAVTKDASATSYCFTFFAKEAEWGFVHYQIDDGTATNRVSGYFDVSSGTASAVTEAGTFSESGADIQDIGNGWHRCEVKLVTDAGTTIRPNLFISDTSSSLSDGDGSSGVYLWGFQLEVGTFTTSYIPTTSAAVLRSNDEPNITGTDFSSWYSQGAGTLFIDCLSNSTTGIYVSLRDSSTSNYSAIIGSTGGGTSIRGVTRESGVTQATVTASGAVREYHKSVYTFDDNDFHIAVDGVLSATPDTSGTVPLTVDTLEIGSFGGGSIINGWIKNIKYWNLRLPNERLQSLTT